MHMTAITLHLSFHPLARRPDVHRLGRRWDVVMKVDGVEQVRQEAPTHRFDVAPGKHQIEVFFRPAGVAFLARWFGMVAGRETLSLDVPATGVELTYTGSMFWHMGGARSLRLAAARPPG